MQRRKLAVLIDAENVSAHHADSLLLRVAALGIPIVSRAYGDFTQPCMKPWHEVILRLGLTPVQQFSSASGKNAADIALVIDAMDLLAGGCVGGFCLVSSDSDFTRLASRIREQGLPVYGFGRATAGVSLRSCCDLFVPLETLPLHDAGKALQAKPTARSDSPEPPPKPAPASATPLLAPKSASRPQPVSQAEPARRLIVEALGSLGSGEDWVSLSALGSQLGKLQPGFRPGKYGHAQLSRLVASLDGFEIRSLASKTTEIRRKP